MIIHALASGQYDSQAGSDPDLTPAASDWGQIRI